MKKKIKALLDSIDHQGVRWELGRNQPKAPPTGLAVIACVVVFAIIASLTATAMWKWQ